ncbi:C45 family autoproteolytic acyltransferase/hydrolase [Draconibacterium sp. IB214405]|uniref:C45 family autoproteolytic acyltransferase/hydolase n=1 Tax=Draconibacterium sp. IB214405 TaxID=3097352 RepID=UPI002A1406E6|nr:C45 family autoproteolytic acyltransferase/hydolase [Draconibacterium sp. IB214405]MDX8339041.1 C45 family autoproteolytic acyltransferase/hydrolase [Draconibacterium sp. IB214405]
MEKIDKNLIVKDVKHVKDSNGGSLYKIGPLDLIVLNGTYKEMGRQYGELAKEKMVATRDYWKKVFMDSGKLTFESIMEVIGTPFYTSAPKTLKDLYSGVAETSGLSLNEVVIMDNWIMLILLGRRAGCSSLVAWGSKTVDGTAYMGRNLDFPNFARELIVKTGIITVLNPVGGDFGVAGMGIAGTLAGYNDQMNSEGLYTEFNNGIGSIEPVTYSNRFDLPIYVNQTLQKFSKIEELKVVFNTVKANYPCILGVCQPDQGAHFELSPETYAVHVSDEYSLRANQFMSPSWGIPNLPGATGWYTKPRIEAWHEAFKATGKSKFDETVFMEVMNAPMWNDDGSLTGTGFSVFEAGQERSAGGGESGDVTMYQIITHSAELKWWVRIPTFTGWLEIDFKKYFK